MTEVQLENTLLAFIAGDYDVLVATTIIETGVDIPNSNTLFIENADMMGLSQLYQLRGRVGRSNRVAYAYFMYRPEKILSEVSEKRLEAIKGFTELGSGFKIAMRDLSIRGAGNLLGSEQSGFIDSVGFDLYSQLLEEAIHTKLGTSKQKKGPQMWKFLWNWMPLFLLIIFLMNVKKLKFINEFVRLIVVRFMKNYKKNWLTVLENIQMKSLIFWKLVY